MKSLRNVFSVLAVTTALIFFAACGGNANSANEHADHEHETPATETEAQEVSEVYYCPMKCEGEKTYDEAGKCPVCGMDLKVKES